MAPSAEVISTRRGAASSRTPAGVEVEIRGCATMEELQACVDLQQQVWGYPDAEVTPRKAFLLARELGGQVIGAFEPGGRMIAFAMALPGIEPVAAGPVLVCPEAAPVAAEAAPVAAEAAPVPGRAGPGEVSAGLGASGVVHGLGRRSRRGGPGQAESAVAGAESSRFGSDVSPAPGVYLHSHMLAVLPEYRNSGLGRRLKLAQREDALARGIRRMTWTFDPLQAKNAYFNLHRLGAIVRRYSPDFYGVSSSRLQGGLPTDRLHAEWWMQSAHVCARLAGPREHHSSAQVSGAAEQIELPHQAEQWKGSEETLEMAREVQSVNRRRFMDAFGRGLAVTDFSRDAEGNGVFELRMWNQTEDAL